MSYFSAHAARIGLETLQHVGLVAAGLGIALVPALPLGVIAARRPKAGTGIFAAAGVLYVIPSLALLALAVQYFGLGAFPVVLVLAAYAQFILIRNIAVALRGVPQAQLDAASGLGFTARQRFWRVELPLAMPVLLSGVRLAAVALIAIATLGGYVGAGGLGNEIFLGLQRRYVEQTLAGSIPAALLAIIADWALRQFERSSRSRSV